MSVRLSRIHAVVVNDLRVRFRRASTVVLFLLLGGSAYLFIPHPSSGMALIVVDGQRAIYNAASIGIGTAALGSVFVGLFGFYAISNALRHDLSTRLGFVIAATPVRGVEYLTGKLIGNVVFLSTFTAGYFLTSVAMLKVRAEAPLELGVFAVQYLVLMPPTIVMVAVLALVFESVPVLAGRFGDVAYFFVWIVSISLATVAAAVLAEDGSVLFHYFDFSGLGLVMENLRHDLGTINISIGTTSFDAARPPLVLNGISLTPGLGLARLTASLLPLALLPIALRSFHRFDPARVRRGAKARRRRRLGQAAAWLKPAAKLFAGLRAGGRAGRFSLANAARQDAFMTLANFPAASWVILAFAFAATFSSTRALQQGLLPPLFVALAILVAGISCREARAGTRSLVWAAPRLKRHFVAWKLLSALVVSALLVLIPLLRLLINDPRAALALAVGTLLVAAAATSLGILAANPKPFIVVFLSFWYVVVNAGDSIPALDFAGFHGTATAGVTATYLGIATAFVAVAVVAHRLRLERDG